ncbi:hypothetical protein SAMN04487944_11310 [Gracilibacillus ureilyticus]|uniref:Uncharacterized protein n=1 Tax=Gracilibacillus ureilyticus TaxID=531814 RepID=A0A1H9T6W3_9BACI|nr:hypothetical protein SAMN04487944_11310 [Gracilibacillus ureilyticus]
MINTLTNFAILLIIFVATFCILKIFWTQLIKVMIHFLFKKLLIDLDNQRQMNIEKLQSMGIKVTKDCDTKGNMYTSVR